MIDESKYIFWTGAPGSRWSGIAKQLCTCPEVDNSDWSCDRQYNGFTHYGNYFGPGMEYGNEFLKMGHLSISDIRGELENPYSEEQNDKIRIFKSHMFARHLRVIRLYFPKSKIVSVYREDDECLKWWLEAGGFDITYPDYSFYVNEKIMLEQISIENQGILDFESDGNYTLKKYDINTLAEVLGLTNPQELTDSWGSKLDEVLIGVYDPDI